LPSSWSWEASASGVQHRTERRTAIDQALTNTAGDESAQLEAYFARARAITLITAHNPAFRDFYDSPGRRASKVEAHDKPIRDVENALAYLERLYPASIGEACFIDRAGPENARYVRGVRAAFRDLSKDESGNPFFKPTFALSPGDVYQAKPYVSADTHEWVISNSTPIPGTGYPASAIVHFEITVESFRRTAAETAKGNEIAIVDAHTGRLLIDSKFRQRVGSVLGRPHDDRFAPLVSRSEPAGTTVIGRSRAAFRRLTQTEHNENDWYVVAINRHPAGLLGEFGWAPFGMFGTALALLVLASFSFRSSRRALLETERLRTTESRRNADERAYHESQREFTEVMQITRDEDEAYELLKRHLERSLSGSEVLVLNRNNSQDRLQAMTALDAESQLQERLKEAEPESCLAVRLGKTHQRRSDREPLLTCELCSATGANSTCVPSLVGGEVIGSVLVSHPVALDDTSSRRIEESMTQASPVLANLRNLALSQARALTDGLTGLPNRRSVDDALKRMAAQSDRSGQPLATVLFDLDHFKQVNDRWGHEKGDEVLAAIGATIASTVRASDFVGRYGGEEFILLLPDTGREGATQTAEKLRQAIAAIDVPGVECRITASFGVAAIPEDASEPSLVLRAADRALYMAKARGRNRVEAVFSDSLESLLS
jgi:diguanylate cyclase (GGDEF)-like protein